MDDLQPRRSASRARPYTLTGGRTRPRINYPLEATVEALLRNAEADWVPGDVRVRIIEMCSRRISIAEISAHGALPIGVTRVLVADLVDSGHLHVHHTLSELSPVSERRRLIERTLSGLRAL